MTVIHNDKLPRFASSKFSGHLVSFHVSGDGAAVSNARKDKMAFLAVRFFMMKASLDQHHLQVVGQLDGFDDLICEQMSS